MRIATFNAGLAPGYLPYVTERVPHVVAALASLEVDLLFVQEFWIDAHFDQLIATTPHLPHVFRATSAEPSRHGTCTREELVPLARCVEKNCRGLHGEALGRCVLHSCAHTAIGVSAECLSCLATHPVGTFEEIVAPCIGDGATTTTPRSSDGGLIAYGGSFGTGLLSNLPLEDRDVLVFESTVNARCALYARVGTTHVFATHLSPGIVHEQQQQINQVLAWMVAKCGGGDRVVLLGDLNTGPRVPPHVTSCNGELYRRFVDAGFDNPYAHDGARCTLCHGSLSRGSHGDSGWLLDHVLLRGFGGARAERILDSPLALGTVRMTLSDHCGIFVDC